MGDPFFDVWILLRIRQEGMFAFDFFGLGDDMSQTGLPIQTDSIISRITIAD